MRHLPERRHPAVEGSEAAHLTMENSEATRSNGARSRPRSGVDMGVIVLAIIFLAAFPLLFKPWIHGFDTVAYYSWLRSEVIDGNLDVGDEFAHYGYGTERGTTPTGHTYNEWAVGSAVLWSPFFLAAHGLSHLARALGLPAATDGYAAQYVWAISVGSACYAFAAVLMTYRLCREFFSTGISVLTTAAVWLSSPLVFYMYSHPAMSHANDAFAYALLLFTWYRTRRTQPTADGRVQGSQRQAWYGSALRGATAGLCALVRQVNAVFILFMLLELILNGRRNGRTVRRHQNGAVRGLRSGRGSWQRVERGHSLLSIAIFSLSWWLVYAPQLVAWRTVFGRWIELNPYARGAGVGFDWLHPHILGVLFSTNRGLFVWTPLLLPAAIGWLLLWRKDNRLTSFLVINFALQLYVVASWGAWSGSAAFGQRFFTNMVPAFALGLAALLTRLEKRVPQAWLVAGCAFFVAWNGLLITRYALEDIPRMGHVPLDELIVGQFTVVPRYFDRIIQILLTRS